jgi:hypothetical protein
MVFTNPIMTTHVNMTTNQALMNLMVVGGYISTNVANLRKGYREPSVVTAKIPDHKDGHSNRPNMIAFKYLDFKKNVDLNVHVRVFNFAIKANTKTFEEHIINAFNYTLKNTTSDYCHNYMLRFLDYIILKLTKTFYKCHRKTHNDEQIYMELKNMKQKENERVEVYYERIQKLAHGL